MIDIMIFKAAYRKKENFSNFIYGILKKLKY